MQTPHVIRVITALILFGTAFQYFSISQAGNDMFTNKTDKNRMLIVISAPPFEDTYYKEAYEKILKYDIEYAKSVIGKDNIVVLADSKAMPILKKYLPHDILLSADMYDIWLRYFTTVNPYKPVQFRYTAAAQSGSQKRADQVQKQFNKFTKKLGISYLTSILKLDGGNVVDNYNDKAIVTERFLKDNGLSKAEGKEKLKKLLSVKSVAIIPSDDESGLAHADGMLMFIDENTLALNRYDEPLRSEILKELTSSFSKIKIIEVETHYEEDDWDPGFSSACGIYTNSIVTNKYIYVPIFGTKPDLKAIKTIQKNTDKTVVPIEASSVCYMGGSVRCLGWQLAGVNADKIINAARESK